MNGSYSRRITKTAFQPFFFALNDRLMNVYEILNKNSISSFIIHYKSIRLKFDDELEGC